jgi:hypothetical protein
LNADATEIANLRVFHRDELQYLHLKMRKLPIGNLPTPQAVAMTPVPR